MGNILNEISAKISVISTKGGAKESLYKKEIFADCKSARNQRAKIRKMLANFINKAKQNNFVIDEKFVKDFTLFYETIYILNDYSVHSICCKDSLKDYSLSDCENLLNSVKSFNNKKNTKK